MNPTPITRRSFLSGTSAAIAAAALTPAGGAAVGGPGPGGFRQPDPKGHPDLFVWTDTCNVYILRDGDAALLIDLGDGSVLERLHEIGVQRVEWVLFTHHHREQCQGYEKLKGMEGMKIGAPAAERALFERPAEFRRMKVRLNDSYTIHGASYVRPPIGAIQVDRAFQKMDTFEWRGREFWCVDARGNSPGAIAYMLRHKDRWLGFSGDVMLDGAKMHTWFDTEWDYGFAAGIHALCNSASLVASFDPAWLLPSHGPAIAKPQAQLIEYQAKLRTLARRLVRGYDVHTFSAAAQDTVSRPSPVPHLWQVTPHLYKFKGPDVFVNFAILLADSGKALVVDCGLMSEQVLGQALEGMRQKLGLKQIDAAVITHMHGDHFLLAPYLRDKWGAKLWAIDRMASMCEHPEHFDYAAPIQAYGGFGGLKFDRLFRSGESFEWEGYTFTIDWMPGQTEFALCMHGMIDGRKVAFTGDNIFGDVADLAHTGNEAVVAHNSGILEEGYIYAAEYLAKLQPDLIIGGHSFVMDRPAALIERYRAWSYQLRDALRALSGDEDYRYGFDPFWVRAEPYRVSLRPGESAQVALHIRNFRQRPQKHRIDVNTLAGLIAEPARLEGELSSESRRAFPLTLRAAPDARPGIRIAAFDVTLDGQRYGEWFDVIVEVRA